MSIKFFINSVKLLLSILYLVLSSYIFNFVKNLDINNIDNMIRFLQTFYSLSSSFFMKNTTKLIKQDWNIMNLPNIIESLSPPDVKLFTDNIAKSYYKDVYNIVIINLVVSCLVFIITILGIYDENRNYLNTSKYFKLPF